MSVGAVAKRYAQALFELGEESGKLSELTEKLSDFSKTYESSRDLRAIFSNPVVTSEQRASLLAAVAQRIGVPEIGIRGLRVMAERGRLPALAATVARLGELADKKAGILRATVTTATEMPESYFQSLAAQLASATGKQVVLKRLVDAALVGGVVTRIGDTLIDGSLRGRLQRVERELLTAVAAGVS